MLIHAAQDKKSPCIASSQIVKVKLFSKKMIHPNDTSEFIHPKNCTSEDLRFVKGF